MQLGLTEFVSYLATVCTIGVFSTGIPTVLKITRKGNTNDVSFFPLLAIFCSCTVWCKYGLLKEDFTIISVNLIGIVAQAIYIFIYYIYTHNRSALHRQLLIGAGLVFPILFYIKFHVEDKDTALLHLGIFCCTLNVISYGSPLVAVAEVLKTRSTETMSFPLVASNFVVSIEWLFYGYLISDPFIKTPNVLGVILGTFQLGLFFKFPRKKSSPTSSI
ncbi:unnamed protein product [Owenia fusiformis]|uniref:Sugar transporter SWEET1 n=1 Tax=Owenia fusiformis TaxID=6347 RepID=A0A8J1TS33_OWEFU|nr:unnamed protein product [Owenia fusiformis]